VALYDGFKKNTNRLLRQLLPKDTYSSDSAERRHTLGEPPFNQNAGMVKSVRRRQRVWLSNRRSHLKLETNNSTAAPSLVQRGCEHVLVVDDDDMVRAHVVRQLVSLGYQVSEARDGLSGLDIIRERSDIDLLFTDIVMPGGMSGLDLAEVAVQLRPELRILFTSGYSENSMFDNGQLKKEPELLQKPYRRKELARRLRKLFDD
jgi:CheY-like chemotaxis protein